jgi:hypothetical protein
MRSAHEDLRNSAGNSLLFSTHTWLRHALYTVHRSVTRTHNLHCFMNMFPNMRKCVSNLMWRDEKCCSSLKQSQTESSGAKCTKSSVLVPVEALSQTHEHSLRHKHQCGSTHSRCLFSKMTTSCTAHSKAPFRAPHTHVCTKYTQKFWISSLFINIIVTTRSPSFHHHIMIIMSEIILLSLLSPTHSPYHHHHHQLIHDIVSQSQIRFLKPHFIVTHTRLITVLSLCLSGSRHWQPSSSLINHHIVTLYHNMIINIPHNNITSTLNQTSYHHGLSDDSY